MAEFDLIRRLQQIVCGRSGSGQNQPVIGIGDDGAVLDVPDGQQLVVTTDTLVEGVHFLADTHPADLGHKSLAVNLSDLAAMGGEPAWFFLALTLPHEQPEWLNEFARGIAGLAGTAGIHLAGGDTTRGPLSVTITAVGLVGRGQALTRSGASEGDLIAVSGVLGDAALALRLLGSQKLPGEDILKALHRPEPRLELGRRLRGLATSCIDISDGLVADLGHILEQSGVGAEIRLDDLPASGSLEVLNDEDRFDCQLCGGDDYELCFTFPPNKSREVERVTGETGLQISFIGQITGSGRLVIKTQSGEDFHPGGRAYEHFSNPRESDGNASF